MISYNKETGNYEKGSCIQGFWQSLLPALLFVVLYTVFQYGGLLGYRHLAASWPDPVRSFVRERPGLCMAAIIVLSMTAALLTVFPEGNRRLRAFREKWDFMTAGREGMKRIPVWICLAVCAGALCILGNAQIQAAGMNSDSVYVMQPLYREIPFPFILIIFAVYTPFAEEFVFRGILYTGLRNRFSPTLSILLAAGLFGLYHAELIQGTYAFLMGLFFCLSMEVTGDIKAPWLLHGISNGLPLVLSYFGFWESFLQRSWRAGTLICFLASAGLLSTFLFRKKGSGRPDA